MHYLQQTFANTTIDVNVVETFLLSKPTYRANNPQQNTDRYDDLLLTRIDCLDFEIRYYLTGRQESIKDVLRQVEAFLFMSEPRTPRICDVVLTAIQKALLEKEWYELLPRYEAVRQSVIDYLAAGPDRKLLIQDSNELNPGLDDVLYA